MWVRKDVALTNCPRSQVTGESEAWLEQYHAFKRFGMQDVMALPARAVHAILVLEREAEREESN